ncbi:hypothetical protein GBAR_LOCUS14608, partial [Geodia barretti]
LCHLAQHLTTSPSVTDNTIRYFQEQCVETKAKRRRRGTATAWHIH